MSARIFNICIFFLAAHMPAIGAGNDTISINIKDAEKRFLDQNLDLLIAKTNIDEAKGLLLQSKLFANPGIYVSRQAYDYSKKETFPASHFQYDLQANQLITTAGKYIKGIEIARKKVTLSEYDYYNILRALKYDLKEKFYHLLQDQQKAALLTRGTNELNILIDAIQSEVDHGYAAKKELIRLQSLLIEFKSTQTELYNSIAENEHNIKVLLNYRGNEYVVPVPDADNIPTVKIDNLKFDSLEQIAMTSRYDLLEANLGADIGKNEWQLAKRQGVPDLTLGTEYDRYGTFESGYLGLSVSMSLPLWNFNQGNIRAAKARYEGYKLDEDKKKLEIHNSLQEEYVQLLNKNKFYKSISANYRNSLEEIYKNIYDSYKSHTIGLIEFIGYFESYKDTKFNLINIDSEIKIQTQKLNFEIGKEVF